MDDFKMLVKRMRAAQKRYFRSRYKGDLETAKSLEAKVDAALETQIEFDLE